MDALATNAYWGRDGIERTILDALAAAGKNTDTLTVDDLAPSDQFHSGGKSATLRLARLRQFIAEEIDRMVGDRRGGPDRCR